ncbi:hypothetical protein M514_10484, partial [Trichuris suis]
CRPQMRTIAYLKALIFYLFRRATTARLQGQWQRRRSLWSRQAASSIPSVQVLKTSKSRSKRTAVLKTFNGTAEAFRFH